MPEIGGVAFGPLVLRDILFSNMDLDMLTAVLEPKVKGAHLLNQRLAKHALEFFVMFSSLAMVCGNPGQSAYSAANAYTHAIARQRRAQGMVASTINIGAVWGVGYIVRDGRDELYEAISFKFDKVSEQELHALFAEAIVSGRSEDVEEDVEIMTGVRFLDPGNSELIPHFHDPRMGHYILPEKRKDLDGANGAARVSVTEQLLNAETLDQVRETIAEALVDKLKTTLQIAREDSVDMDVPLIDQGVDSLSAVAIGTWFSKNLKLDLPVLKILGGASINDLSQDAADRLPPSAIPLIHASQDNPPESENTVNGDQNGIVKPTGADKINGHGALLAKIPDSRQTTTIQRVATMSLQQEHHWKIQRFSDPVEFNTTIGMWMKGYMDLNRLSQAFEFVLQRHEACRTCFPKDDRNQSLSPKQVIMDSPYVRFQAIAVADRAAAEREFDRVDRDNYDVEIGDTLKAVDFHWTPTDHLLIIAYNQLVCDGWSYEQIFVEIGKVYDGRAAELAPAHQYADFAAQQRSDYEQGRMAADLTFWKSLHTPLPSPLSLLSLPGVKAQSLQPLSSNQYTQLARLSRDVASRVRKASQRVKATPMQFFLATYMALLVRLSGSEDVAIGVADANRSTLQDLSTVGFYLNALPIRMRTSPKDRFEVALASARTQMRSAVLHSRVPAHIISEHLDLAPNYMDSSSPTLFQAVFDYKQGQAESGSIGGANMVGVLASRSRTSHPITLEISDDPTKAPLITFKLQSSMYAEEGMATLMESYFSLLDAFSSDLTLEIQEVVLE